MESLNSLSLYKRYHSSIRRVHSKLKVDFPDIDKKTRLSIAVHSVNTTIESDGLTLYLLFFESFPRIPLPNLSTMALSQKQRFKAMAAARQEMETLAAQRRVFAVPKHRIGVLPHPMYEFVDSVLE